MTRIAKNPQLLALCWLAVTCVTVGSCSDKYKNIYTGSAIPLISFNVDTLTVRERDSFNIVSPLYTGPFLRIYTKPLPLSLHLLFSESSGKLSFFYRGIQQEDSKPIIVAGDSTILFCRSDTAGFYPADFFLVDRLGRIAMKTLIVHALSNDRPIAVVNSFMIDSTLPDNWRYRMDASASQKKLGKIRGYFFTIDSVPVVSYNPVIDWIFYRRGEHVVRLYVSDDLNTYSDTVTQKLFIQ